MTNTLVIARGLPGSGKSTAVETHGALTVDHLEFTGAPLITVCSADFYWGKPYKFDASKLQEAHLYCRLSALVGMKHRSELVYIDNTNIKRKDYQVYIDLAKEYGYNCKLLEANTPWVWDVDECVKRNVHGVPREAIQRMKDNYEIDNEFETIKLPYDKGSPGESQRSADTATA